MPIIFFIIQILLSILGSNKVNYHKKRVENWEVTLVDTGHNTLTGGRLKRIRSFVENEEQFCFTYGDGLSDINLKKSIKFSQIKKQNSYGYSCKTSR